MLREIETHKVNGLNEAIHITVHDEPGAGGACHRYDVTGFDTHGNPAERGERGYSTSFSRLPIIFQHGPLAESGVNGISNEALLAIVRDRLEGFQSGAYACEENAEALACVMEAMDWLHSRTTARLARGVEGTSAP